MPIHLHGVTLAGGSKRKAPAILPTPHMSGVTKHSASIVVGDLYVDRIPGHQVESRRVVGFQECDTDVNSFDRQTAKAPQSPELSPYIDISGPDES